MIFKLGVLAALPMLALAVATAALGPVFVVVDVREGSKDGTHIVVPAPLSVVRAAVLLSPVDLDARQNDLRRVAPVAHRLLEDLRRAPDFDIVRVTEPDETVSIRKTGTKIQVDVAETDGDRVHVSVPIAFAQDLLRRMADGRLTSCDVSQSLGKLSRGQVLDVRDGADHVSVRVY